MAFVVKRFFWELFLIAFILVPCIDSVPVGSNLNDGSLEKMFANMKGFWERGRCFFPSTELYTDQYHGVLSTSQDFQLKACSVDDEASDDKLSFRSTLCKTFFNVSQLFCNELNKQDVPPIEKRYLHQTSLDKVISEKGSMRLCEDAKIMFQRRSLVILTQIFQNQFACQQCEADKKLGHVCDILFSSILNYLDALTIHNAGQGPPVPAGTGRAGIPGEAVGGQGNEPPAGGNSVTGPGGVSPGGGKPADEEDSPAVVGHRPAVGAGNSGVGQGSPGVGAGNSGGGQDSSGVGAGRPAVGVSSPVVGVSSPAVEENSPGAISPAVGQGGLAVVGDSPAAGPNSPADGAGIPADGAGIPADGAGIPADGAGIPAVIGSGSTGESGGKPPAGDRVSFPVEEDNLAGPTAAVGEDSGAGQGTGRQTSLGGEGQPSGPKTPLTAPASGSAGLGSKPPLDAKDPVDKSMGGALGGIVPNPNSVGAGGSYSTPNGKSTASQDLTNPSKGNEPGVLTLPSDLSQPTGDGARKTGTDQDLGGAGENVAQPNKDSGFLNTVEATGGAGRTGGNDLTRLDNQRAPDALNTLGAPQQGEAQGNRNVFNSYDRPPDQNSLFQQGGGNVGGLDITGGKRTQGQVLPPNPSLTESSSSLSTQQGPDNGLDMDDDDEFWESPDQNQGILSNGLGQNVGAPARKPPVQSVPEIPPDGVQSLDNAMQHTFEESSPSGHFMAYFITAVVLCVAGYVIYHNKQKIFAIALEGRRDSQRRRPASGGESGSSAKYSKLQTTVEEVVPALEKSTSSKNYIY